jgi:hypothetical protein
MAARHFSMPHAFAQAANRLVRPCWQSESTMGRRKVEEAEGDLTERLAMRAA